MRTYIVGTGGTGGYFGGLLSRARKDVTFVARGDHYRAMRKTGLFVNSVRGNFNLPKPPIVDGIAKIEDPELVLVFVKTYDTDQVACQLSKVIQSETTVITFQTGLENDLEIKKEIDTGRVFPGIAYINSSCTSPGVINQISGPCTLTFGARQGHNDAALAKVEEFLRAAGIDATLSDNIEYDMWKKLVWISTFAGITVLFRAPAGRILSDTVGETLFRKCLEEGFAVAASRGVLFSIGDRKQIIDKVEYYKREGQNAKTSLLLDMEGGRRTEIETLHGIMVRYARQSGIEVPLLETIYSIVKVHEKTVAAKK